ncbi:MAG: sigma-70 family RNA polymerase sigma factor [Candidatus Nanoarchaeia archaeon]|nr:sigma-70 family RNA polymerase sigma factor [Candidatus Nanoarchaeia archaeon]
MSKYLSFDEIKKHNWQDFFKHYANHRKNWKRITLEENLQLIETYQRGGKEGEKAINKLTDQYITYVSNLVKDYVPLGEYWGDFLQEGLLTFSSCLKNYNPSKGHPGSYVAKCVNNAMKLKLNKLSKYTQKTICTNNLCLEPIQNEEDLYRRLFREEDLNKGIKQVFENVCALREQEILMDYFGLLNVTPKKVRVIAKNQGVSSARINQIKEKCIERLKRVEKKKPFLKNLI